MAELERDRRDPGRQQRQIRQPHPDTGLQIHRRRFDGPLIDAEQRRKRQHAESRHPSDVDKAAVVIAADTGHVDACDVGHLDGGDPRRKDGDAQAGKRPRPHQDRSRHQDHVDRDVQDRHTARFIGQVSQHAHP